MGPTFVPQSSLARTSKFTPRTRKFTFHTSKFRTFVLQSSRGEFPFLDHLALHSGRYVLIDVASLSTGVVGPALVPFPYKTERIFNALTQLKHPFSKVHQVFGT